MKFKNLNDDTGFSVLAAVGIMAVFSSLALALGVLENARQQERNATHIEARRKISERISDYLKSETMMSYNLANQNSPNNNVSLRDCIVAGTPSVTCPNTFGIEFYQPLPAGASEKIIGSAAMPAFQNQYGDFCEPLSNTNGSNCYFMAVSKCLVVCPGGQTACGMVKLLQCDIEVSTVASSFLSKYLHQQKTSQFASTYSIRLSRDKTTYLLSHE